ncbi:MAG: hypothetical protein QFX35_05825 [Candidatus Verstraetearchaeota archaeon]|nr:hypothetical protein [Candidatus Verstraetearchaeota archaeon]
MDRKTYRFMRYWSDPFYDFCLDLNGIDVMDVATPSSDGIRKHRRDKRY